MKPEQKEQYVRWQNYRITQLSFTINLFLGFGVASLAYVINLKLTQNGQDPELLIFIIKMMGLECWAWMLGNSN